MDDFTFRTGSPLRRRWIQGVYKFRDFLSNLPRSGLSQGCHKRFVPVKNKLPPWKTSPPPWKTNPSWHLSLRRQCLGHKPPHHACHIFSSPWTNFPCEKLSCLKFMLPQRLPPPVFHILPARLNTPSWKFTCYFVCSANAWSVCDS